MMALNILNYSIVSLATIPVLSGSCDAHILTSRLRAKFKAEESPKKALHSASKYLSIETLGKAGGSEKCRVRTAGPLVFICFLRHVVNLSF